jgi:hypothetical protein
MYGRGGRGQAGVPTDHDHVSWSSPPLCGPQLFLLRLSWWLNAQSKLSCCVAIQIIHHKLDWVLISWFTLNDGSRSLNGTLIYVCKCHWCLAATWIITASEYCQYNHNDHARGTGMTDWIWLNSDSSKVKVQQEAVPVLASPWAALQPQSDSVNCTAALSLCGLSLMTSCNACSMQIRSSRHIQPEGYL